VAFREWRGYSGQPMTVSLDSTVHNLLDKHQNGLASGSKAERTIDLLNCQRAAYRMLGVNSFHHPRTRSWFVGANPLRLSIPRTL
jgi:hypothetical protein